jgi:hypothetical protein
LFGRTGPEALKAYRGEFAAEIPALTTQYEAKQKAFKPGILDSGSFDLLANVLRGSAR